MTELLDLPLPEIEVELSRQKATEPLLFKASIKELKIAFIKSEGILELNKIALVFQTFKIHSSVPLIIEKLSSDKFDDNGGTLVYALEGLRIKDYRSSLVKISKRKSISWEMKAMFDILGIKKFKDLY